jgi:beta-lactamase superfamily II metal-dependent hydrolase
MRRLDTIIYGSNNNFDNKMKIRKTLTLFVILALFQFFPFSIEQPYAQNVNSIIYTMVDVCGEPYQGDAHILRFANGLVYAIDAGQGSKFATYLKNNNITAIDKFFVSHAHKDHYNGIINVIQSGIKINTVFFNVPDKEVCDTEKPWGCDYKHILETIKFIKDHNISVENLKEGDSFAPQDDTVVTVLAVFDGSKTPIGKTDINDTSAIMKLTHGKTSILFTGDLNARLSEYLVKSKYDVKADILKVPHHGTEGVATNDFFDAVSPKLALVPSPYDLWLSDRSKRIRDYFSSKSIPTLISGIDKDVNILLFENKYEIVKISCDAGKSQRVYLGDKKTEEVNLDASKSSVSYGSIKSFVWSEGGNQITSDIKPTIILDKGVHNINLAITGDNGLTTVCSVKIEVLEKPKSMDQQKATDKKTDRTSDDKYLDILEKCTQQYESCIENCENNSCEEACLKELSVCEKNLPKELKTIK